MTNMQRATRTLGAAVAASAALVAAAHADVAASSPARVNAFLINEIGFGKQPYVALTNFTKTPSTLTGLYLCQGNRCSRLPKATVKPGATVRIAAGNGAGLTNVVARHASIGTLRPTSGETALYSARALQNPKAMMTYMQWGSPTHSLTPVALKAGLWRKGVYAISNPSAVQLKRTAGGLWTYTSGR